MATDGRDARWDQHRVDRKRELVSHALRAIRVHGPGVSLEDIAARAGTSKTVLYRHFGGRAGLYADVVDSVHAYIRADLTAALDMSQARDLAQLTTTLTDGYLALVERDPDIYRFVMNGAGGAGAVDPAGRVPIVIASSVAAVIVARAGDQGIAAATSQTWAHGLVGFIQAVADRWMDDPDREPRRAVVDRVGALFAPAFAAATHTSQAEPVTASALATSNPVT
ncbi:TetR/AcrR family transcriptional regulator [Demequina sp. NBRC 110055]|uniref:TetR/AcrR family transcriptional regulator n=1 Tax=Demequina sp. NBRC 110055 TaxID=1570344 RepID=UPI0013562D3D|nr:TetR/AcrR family transcriptional regulator [Demequina sp. NBRC 110055]